MKIRTDFVTNSSSSSFAVMHVKGSLIEELLHKCGFSNKYFDELCDCDGPFGNESPLAYHLLNEQQFKENIADTLIVILEAVCWGFREDRLTDPYFADFKIKGNGKTSDRSLCEIEDDIVKLIKLINENKVAINENTFADLEFAYVEATICVLYKKMLIENGTGELLQVNTEEDETLIFVDDVAMEEFEEEYEEYCKTEEFKIIEKNTKIYDEIYDTVAEQYWDEMMEGKHPEFFKNRELTSAMKWILFTLESKAYGEAGLDYVMTEDVIREWARYMGNTVYIGKGAKENNIIETKKDALNGIIFVVTGDLETFSSRNELKAFIEERGGKLVGSVSSKTNYLITNTPDSGTKKNVTAQELGVAIITEKQFLEMAKNDKV